MDNLFPRPTMAPCMDDWVALMAVIVMRHQYLRWSIDIIPMCEEPDPSTTLFTIKDVVQIRVDRDIQFSMTCCAVVVDWRGESKQTVGVRERFSLLGIVRD